MGEACRHIDLQTRLGAELDGDMSAIGRRAAADVHRHIEDGAPGHAHKLDLRFRVGLEVKSSHDTPARGVRVIVLNELCFDPGLPEGGGLISLGEKPAMIAVATWTDEQDL